MEDKPLSDNFAFVDTLLDSPHFRCPTRYNDHNSNNNNDSNVAITAQKLAHSTPDSSYQNQKDYTATAPATIQLHPLVLCMQRSLISVSSPSRYDGYGGEGDMYKSFAGLYIERQTESTRNLSKHTRGRKQYRRPHHDSDDSSEEGWSKESDDGNNHTSSDNDYDSDRPLPRPRPRSRTTVNPRPPGVIMTRTIEAGDPFVPERNVTLFCNGWRLRHVCRVFEKSYLMLVDQVGMYDENQDVDKEWGRAFELDEFRDATSSGTPTVLAQLMCDIHDPLFGQLGHSIEGDTL
ncbi:hypothetical protein KI688_009130 [Linnemannia hyalina]|uniref:Uncharacterized protein n=1 Tax=Linnemannia hyalina TaxID=64524 RepID=A0A9P8BVG5_9FUNG|nr:hypothetical protein KI688_009130 [Linnemannia hyalina]